MTTRAQLAGLRLEDVPSLAKLARQHREDAKMRRALGQVLRQRPKS